MHYKRNSAQPPATSKILAARVPENLKFWRYFVANGYIRAWEFAHQARCICPDLTLHPVTFKKQLGMLDDGRDLNVAISRRLRKSQQQKQGRRGVMLKVKQSA